MTAADLEIVYDALATQLDTVAAEKRTLFLAKLALLLCHDLNDASHAVARIAEAAANIDV